MTRSLTTLLLAISGFPDSNSEDSKGLIQIKPQDVTRVAFDKKGGYQAVQISNETGPVNDGMLEVIDAIKLDEGKIDIQDADCALIVRVQSSRGMDSYVAQKIGEAIEAYMSTNKVTEFATAAIADIAPSQELHGKWNTLLLTRDANTGKWDFKNLRFTSVQKSTGNSFAILRDGKLAKTDGGSLISTLLDSTKLNELIDGGRVLDGSKQKHLVRAPIQVSGAYAVVDENGQTVYDDDFKVIAYGQTGFVVMPAINEDGTYANGKVTTVSGKGNDWDIRPSISASKAGDLAQAYGASAA